MQNLGLNEIREKYLQFFEGKGHLRLPSFSLVPQNDASLLLINAGMAPLKPFFTGKEVPPKNRVTTCQKCIRTPDIERVGKTARHGTFFEMLGNFSFGDYFKHEATAWAWEFVTKVMGIPVDKLWVSIYEEDDEAFDIWTKEVGVDPERIVRLGKEDNFWEIGTGPCGPCSEIYVDRGEARGCGKPGCGVGCDCDRFVEIWNLVFTQFDKDEAGNYNRLDHPNIDTGMGLERLAVVMQDVENLFEVDTIRNIMMKISQIAGVAYKENEKTDVSLRVITDHIRSTVFLVSDGVMPSNEGRGYVLRRLLRRAARHGKLLGIKDPFLYQVADTVIHESCGAYPELREKADYIKTIIKQEEERFDKTIDAGLDILNGYIAGLKAEKSEVLSGENAFKLYDTYGFPIDLTIEILEENGMRPDMEGFEAEMEAQRTRARSARGDQEGAGWDDDVFSRIKGVKTKFSGYTEDSCSAKVLAMAKDEQEVQEACAGDQVVIVTDATVFYGESGGQVGDTGRMIGQHVNIEVTDTKKAADGKYLHSAVIKSGSVKTGDVLNLVIDAQRRLAIQRNHSATHLLQKALRLVLGDHVEQSGSYVTPERLRFDFTHFAPMTAEELRRVEDEVNRAILSSFEVEIFETDIKSARQLGAMALFGEKYGDVVRVVKMGNYSIELCGGCHLKNTACAGLFKLTGESGVAAGIRRIEGVTGSGVLEYIHESDKILEDAAQVLKTSRHDLAAKAESLTKELRETQRELGQAKSKMAGGMAGGLLENAIEVGGVKIVTAKLENMDADSLRKLGDSLKEKEPSLLAVLAGVQGEKAVFVAMASKDAVKAGVHAGNIIREVAKAAGGGGGGKPDSAQAGAKDLSKIDQALGLVAGLVEKK